MSDKQRAFLELKPGRQGYEARVHRGDPASGVSLRKIGLGRDARVIVKDGSYALGELIDLLAGDNLDRKAALFDERGQLALGQYLYGETLGKGKSGIGERLRDEDAVLVRVVTEDEDLARLPWALLARGGRFLCATGWSVMLCDTAECTDCTLPPSPRILMVMPEPGGVPGTEAGAHIDELEALLSGSDPYLERGQHLALVHTWEDLPHRAFERMLLDEFGVNALDDIPARILAEASWQSGRQTLLYVRHAPVSLPGHVIRTEVLKTYLEWCKTMLVPVLRAQGIFALLCIPVQAEVPARFRARLEQAFGARHLRLKDTYGYVLGEFQDVTVEDLHHFCDTHNIPLPEGEQRNKLFDAIIRETGGLYEPTLEALKDLERRYWATRRGPAAHETRATNGDEGY